MKYTLTSKTLFSELSTTKLKNYTTSKTLYYELREYSEDIPIFKIILDFLDIFGGIY